MLPRRGFQPPEAATLARRLLLLQDFVEALRGQPYTFGEVAEFLQSKGVSVSRSKWGYMLAGDQWRVREQEMLDALAELYEVPPAYLYGEGDLPHRLESEMNLVLAMRAARVRNFAARNLSDLAPEALDAITAALKDLDERSS